ncbi:MAG: flagellar hook-associated protein FlgK, partial [Sphingomonas sp.]
SDLLNIGASGVTAYGKALGVVGENIANAQSTGYVRRDARLTTQGITATGGATIAPKVGSGVRVASVTRSTDAFRVADSRLTSADAARASARSRWLTAAETALPGGSSGVPATLTAVYNAGDALAGDPDGAVPRQRFLGAVDEAAGALRIGAEGLARVSEGITQEAQGSVDALNGALGALVKINASLMRTPPGTSAAANLADQRDAAIDTIAAQAGVDVAIGARGTATITLSGTPTVLADVNGAVTVDLAQAQDGRLSLSIGDGGRGTTLQPLSGALSGLTDAASAVASRRRQLDGVAIEFAGKMNAWSAAGRDAAGAQGGPLLMGTGAANIALVITDPAQVAAANDDAENGNALTLGAQRGAGGVEERAATLISGLAQTVAAAKAESSAASSRADSSALMREETSGVDLDREAADLLRFQQAYSGAAKVIQTARETLQSILSLF